jgi:hypothetical protein
MVTALTALAITQENHMPATDVSPIRSQPDLKRKATPIKEGDAALQLKLNEL